MAEYNPDANDADGRSKPPSFQPSQATAESIDEIRQYLSDLHARRDVIKRTGTKSGQEFDWVPIESQVADGKIATPPDDDQAEVPYDPDRPTRRVPLELEEPGAELGPPGTVPLVRYPIERITPDGGLRDWLSKSGHARRNAPPDAFFPRSAPPGYNVHAAAFHSGQNYGTEGVINVWRPWVEWSDEFSLGQLWVYRGADYQKQTVEVGLQVSKSFYGDWEPHIFIYFTTNNYASEHDYIGGYNRDVKGWCQTSQTVAPGSLVTATSQIGGAQYDMGFKVQFQLGNWWIKVNGQWMGYYPNSLFASTGLHDLADQVVWGGEVFDAQSHPETTATDMGSGLFPWEGFARAAYMRNLMVSTDQSGTLVPFSGDMSADQTDCYNISGDLSGTGPWGSYFYWGGTGRNSACP